MSNSHLFLTAGYIRPPLKNGIGRYICQLQRVTIKFCKTHGGSQGVRHFIETELIDFARKHPQVVVYVKPRRHRSPGLVAEFCNGEVSHIPLQNMNKDEVYKWLNLCTTQTGREVMRYKKLSHTDSPSIQGVWSPHTFATPQMLSAKFPLANFCGPLKHTPTATEVLLDMYNKEKSNAAESTSSDVD